MSDDVASSNLRRLALLPPLLLLLLPWPLLPLLLMGCCGMMAAWCGGVVQAVTGSSVADAVESWNNEHNA